MTAESPRPPVALVERLNSLSLWMREHLAESDDLIAVVDDAAAALAAPPPDLVARLLRVLRDYDLRDDIHGLGPEVADAYDALVRAYPLEKLDERA